MISTGAARRSAPAGGTGAAVRTLGGAGLAAIGLSVAAFLATALLGPSAMQPALPGPAGRPPYSLDAHPSPYVVIGLVVLGVLSGATGLGLCLCAMRRGWRYPPRRLLVAGLVAAAAFVIMPPVGSADHLNYAVYGRMVVTGHDPYVTGARDLPGDPIAAVVEPPWREEPTIYGPIATGQEAVASWIGGDSVRLTVFVLSLTNALAFAFVGLMLYRMTGRSGAGVGAVGTGTDTGAGRLRSVLLWTGNPLLLFHLVSGAHNDVLAIAAAVGALAVFSGGVRRNRGPHGPDDESRAVPRLPRLPRILSTGALLGIGAAIKLPAALAGGGPAWVLLSTVPSRLSAASGHRRADRPGRSWPARLGPVIALGAAAAVVAVLAYVPAGAHAFDQVQRASRSVSLATPWHLVDVALGRGAHRPIIQVGSLILVVVLCRLLLRLLPGAGGTGGVSGASGIGGMGDVRGDGPRIAAALTLAWLLAAPYALPWYDAFGWAMLALVPLSAVDGLLLARTAALGLAYLPARDPQVVRLPDGLSWLFTVVRPTLIPWALTVILVVLVALAVVRSPRRPRRWWHRADRRPPAPAPVSPPRA